MILFTAHDLGRADQGARVPVRPPPQTPCSSSRLTTSAHVQGNSCHPSSSTILRFDLLRVACPSLTYLIGKLSRLATRSAVPLKAALTTDWTHTKGEMARRGVRPGTRSAGLMHRTMSHCSHIESRCLSRPNRTLSAQPPRRGTARSCHRLVGHWRFLHTTTQRFGLYPWFFC